MASFHTIVGLKRTLILCGISVIMISFAGASNNLKAENGDGGPATEASINGPDGISIDSDGNVYIAEMMGRRVRRVDAKTGLISTIAGNGAYCCFQEGKSATANTLFSPIAIAVDSRADIYIADTSSHVRRVDATTGIVTTVISERTGDYPGKPGIAPSLPGYEQVKGLAVDSSGVLYISGSSRGRIYTVADGVVSVFGGIGGHGYAGDGKSPKEAQFSWPMDIAFAPDDALVIADYENCRIRKVPIWSRIHHRGHGQVRLKRRRRTGNRRNY